MAQQQFWWSGFTPAPGSAPVPRAPRAHAALAPPPVPATGWQPPKTLPNLSGVKVLGLDIETCDPELTTRGPGGVRGTGYPVGVSLATHDAAWYLPFGHTWPAEQALQFDRALILQYLNDTLPGKDIVGANLMYDLEHLRAAGVNTQACSNYFDVQFAEPLIDENSGSYSLDALGRKYGLGGKATNDLYGWAAAAYGGNADAKQRANIWRCPPSLTGPYAEQDAQLPLRILEQQRAVIASEGLEEVFALECGLIPLLLDMRFEGVPIDVPGAERTAAWLRAEAARAQAQLGEGISVWAQHDLAKLFTAAGVSYPYTDNGAPSFTKAWLENCPHSIAAAVLAVRQYEKAANPFVESYLLGAVHHGHVHCQFHPLRSDDYGAVSGRFSSSDPNLQNIPARNKVLGPMLRSLFIPKPGHRWRKMDYSQIEYRLLAHYAIGRGADELRNAYVTNALMDYHARAAAQVLLNTGVELERGPAKSINFGMVYGMGRAKLIRSIGAGEAAGQRLYDAFFEANPYVRETFNGAERLVKKRGYIKTVLGRRRRFVNGIATHKALNALLQGGAADIMKKGMLECYRAGVFRATGTPHLTVHDELDWSDAQTRESEEGFMEAKRILETCVPLRVPLIVEQAYGANWGAAK